MSIRMAAWTWSDNLELLANSVPLLVLVELRQIHDDKVLVAFQRHAFGPTASKEVGE